MPSIGSTGKLPLTLYETTQGIENPTGEDENSKATFMQIDGDEALPFKFRVVTYSIDTDETEMIGIDYIAKGGGNATLQGSGGNSSKQALVAQAQKLDPRGAQGNLTQQYNGDTGSPTESSKRTATSTSSLIANDSSLSPLEADQVASLGTRLNSVKMLLSRLQLLHNFLTALPASYLSNVELSETFIPETEMSHVRSIAALLKQLSLLDPKSPPPAPSESDDVRAFSRAPDVSLQSASLAQKNDSNLLNLISALTKSIQSTSEIGRKHAAIENARQQAKSKKQNTAFGALGHAMGGNGFGAYGSRNNLTGIPDEGYEGEAAHSWQ